MSAIIGRMIDAYGGSRYFIRRQRGDVESAKL